MRKKILDEKQILYLLKRVNDGEETVKEVCQRYNFSLSTYYNWKKKYDGMCASSIKKLNDLQKENLYLRKKFADLSIEISILKEMLDKKTKR